MTGPRGLFGPCPPVFTGSSPTPKMPGSQKLRRVGGGERRSQKNLEGEPPAEGNR